MSVEILLRKLRDNTFLRDGSMRLRSGSRVGGGWEGGGAIGAGVRGGGGGCYGNDVGENELMAMAIIETE